METDFNFADTEEADRITALLLKQLRQTISPAEQQQLNDWMLAHPIHKQIAERLSNEGQLLADLLAFNQVDKQAWWQTISARAGIKDAKPFLLHRWVKYVAAAVVLLVATGIVLWMVRAKSGTKATEDNMAAMEHVLAGGNVATLTLADGSVINLGSAANDTLAQLEEATVVKSKDGELRYDASQKHNKANNTAYNLLSTPRGGQYSLVLPDGTKVWLNATSSIKYPTYFSNKERRVTITGEVYFEVQPAGSSKNIPFIVSVISQTGTAIAEVEAMGTEFNINAYVEEASIRTTLLQGKVKVSVATQNERRRNTAYKIVTPGQQAQIAVSANGTLASDSIQLVNQADTETAVAWKNGLHSFKNADIKTIMRMLGRWYNVDIAYEGRIPDYKFTGSIPRNENMPAVLHMLQYAGIHFRVEGDKIIVTP